MNLFDLFAAQLADPFRIGLLVFLVLTTLRTAHHTGRLVPLALGVLFVAVLIPTTFGSPGDTLVQQVAVGLAANAVIVAIVYAIALVVMRMVSRTPPA